METYGFLKLLNQWLALTMLRAKKKSFRASLLKVKTAKYHALFSVQTFLWLPQCLQISPTCIVSLSYFNNQVICCVQSFVFNLTGNWSTWLVSKSRFAPCFFLSPLVRAGSPCFSFVTRKWNIKQADKGQVASIIVC